MLCSAGNKKIGIEAISYYPNGDRRNWVVFIYYIAVIPYCAVIPPSRTNALELCGRYGIIK